MFKIILKKQFKSSSNLEPFSFQLLLHSLNGLIFFSFFYTEQKKKKEGGRKRVYKNAPYPALAGIRILGLFPPVSSRVLPEDLTSALVFFPRFCPVCPFLEQVQERVALLAQLEAGSTCFLLFLIFLGPVFMGPVLTASALPSGRLSRDFLPRRRRVSRHKADNGDAGLQAASSPVVSKCKISSRFVRAAPKACVLPRRGARRMPEERRPSSYVPETAPPHPGP